MIVIILTACPEGLRGHLTQWLLELSAGVYIGHVNSRIRHRPGGMTRIRSTALNILRANGVQNVSQALFVNALNLDRLLALGSS